MKKRIIAVLIIFSMLVGTASAALLRDFRWAYFASSVSDICMVDGKIEWSGDATTYSFQEVTNTKVTVKLQIATPGGWGTIETKTESGKNDAGYLGTYSGWSSGKSYRVSVEAWAYNGTKQLEYIGPFYEYLYT